jgi:uridine kinase
VELVDRLAAWIDRLHPGGRLLVAFDGPDAAGKTTLAREVGTRLVRPVVNVSRDDWHNPREVRLRRGAESAEGFYRDSFDLGALTNECLAPFRAGVARIRTAGFDYRRDEPVDRSADVAANAVLLIDGVFLLRPELRDLWDIGIYLDVPETVTLARAVERDLSLFGSEAAVRQRYAARYLPGQALYRAEASPTEVADLLVDNSDPGRPVIVRGLADD